MPPRTEILSGLALIANDAIAIAMAWHVLVLAGGIALAAGWRPSRRLAGILLTLPLASASVLALIYRNPFNATVVGFLTVLLGFLALKLGRDQVELGPPWCVFAGVGMIAFGWFYPHFLDPSKPLTYLYAAPTGLIPCPSLALVVGFGLLAGGLGSGAWSIALAGGALSYGVFGVLCLSVFIDLVLLCGASALLIIGWAPSRAGLRR